MHRNFPQPSAPASNAVHQAVDIAYSIADLISNWFDGNGTNRPLFVQDGTPLLTLNLDTTQARPLLYFQNQDPSNIAVITTAQCGSSGNGDFALGAQTFIVQSGQTQPFTNFTQYTKGLLTATMVPHDLENVPVAAVTGRNLSTSNGVPLISNCSSFSIDTDAGTVTLDNTKGPYAVGATFTVQTGAPNQTFVLEAAAPSGGLSTVNFPTSIGGQLISQLNTVLYANPSSVLAALEA